MATTVTSFKILMDQDDWPQAEGIFDNVAAMIAADTALMTATWAEINAVCDMSGKVVAPATGNLALTAALHGNRYVYYDDADGIITLPAATGTGYKYTVVIKTPFTAGKIWCASAADSFLGGINGVDDDSDAAYAWKAETADDTILGSGTATGGKAGDWYEFTDVATGLFLVNGFITQSGGSEATPFSASVS